ncbi:MAG: NmrA family NAD(P)-binding protein [Saprospiraceae bacterium]|nr:NmrA family NAD(P)-binding protein [Candidatus Vicinibacter affinis]
MNFIIIRSTAFMETHIHELMGKGILKNGKAMIMGKGNNPLNFVSVVDVAQIILKSIEQPEALNSIIEIGGPDNLSRNEIVSLYEKYSGKEVKCTYLSIGFLNIMSKLFKPFHQGISRVMALGEVLDQTDQTFDPTRTLQKFPIKLTTIEHFIKQQCK